MPASSFFEPIPQPILDTRNEADIVRAAQSRIYEQSERTLNDFSPASPLSALIEGQAIAVAEYLYWLNQLPLAFSLEWLRKLGIQRRVGAQSATTLEFTKPQGFISAVTVPRGFIVSATNGSRFTTDEPLFIGQGVPSGTVSATSQQIGTANNVQTGSINRIVIPLIGVQSVTNTIPATGALDQETESEMLSRAYALLRRRTLSTQEDFRLEVLTILGNGANVKAFSGPDFGFPNQPFHIYIVGVNSDESLLTTVQTENIIDSLRPRVQIGTQLTVQSVTIEPMTVRTEVRIGDTFGVQDTAVLLANTLRDFVSPTVLNIGADLLVNEVARRLYESARVQEVNSFSMSLNNVGTEIGCDGRVVMSSVSGVPQLRRVVITVTNTSGSFIFDLDL